jgi:lipopolysaccharide/colanic/teichoic acid biosynthesis glycosyltransferase
MTPSKRLFDLVIALALAVILLPVGLIMAAVIWALDGRPVLYLSERMKTPTQGFKLAKFRSMTVVAADSGVSGGDKSARITRTGAFLRRSRLDVDCFPDIYAQVLKSRPGITGLATIIYHRHEEMLLARSNSRAETDAIYARACVPRKARLDLIYQRRRTLCLDAMLMLKTVFRRLPLKRKRPGQ